MDDIAWATMTVVDGCILEPPELARAFAAVWEQGYIVASGDALRDEGCEVFIEDADNPYREA